MTRARCHLLALLCASLALAGSALGLEQSLKVIYQWKQLEYDWANEATKSLFPHYKQEDNLPLGLEVAGDRLFVTVPRWRRGAVATLNYVYLNDTRESPPLTPYPSWEAHTMAPHPEIVSTFRVRADRCNRLWVLDTGLTDILGNPEQLVAPALLVYDLQSDRVLRRYTIPEEQRTPDSLFANIAIEDYDCDDAFGYFGDLGGPGLVVYSWRTETSWLVKHQYFAPDPEASDFSVGGVNFHWKDGLFGLALEPTGDGYSNLYFHPLSSTLEYMISTKVLRDTNRLDAPDVFHQFKQLGSRGANGQSATSFLDPQSGVLFYTLTNLNAIACWRPDSRYLIQQQGRVYMDNVTMVFPNDIKVDRQGHVWVLSDRLPTFMYQQLDPNDFNFRILRGSAAEAIRGTVCAAPRDLYSTPAGFTTAPATSSSERPAKMMQHPSTGTSGTGTRSPNEISYGEASTSSAAIASPAAALPVALILGLLLLSGSRRH